MAHKFNKSNIHGDGGFKVYPPGRYQMEIVAVTEEISESANTKGQVKFKVSYQIKEGSEQGGRFTDFMYPESKAGFMVGQLLEAMGLVDEDDPEVDEIVVDTADWPGHVVEVALSVGMWNGKETNDLDGFRPSDLDPGVEGAVHRREELRAMAGAAAGPPQHTDDDCPF